MKHRILLVLVSFTVLAFSATTGLSSSPTVINKCQKISKAGEYELGSDIGKPIETTYGHGKCLTIVARGGEVVLDGKDHTIQAQGETSGGAGLAIVVSQGTGNNITIKNLTIKGDPGKPKSKTFKVAVGLTASKNRCEAFVTLENVVIDGMKKTGVTVNSLKMKNSKVINTGGEETSSMSGQGVITGGGPCKEKVGFPVEIKGSTISRNAGFGLEIDSHPDGGNVANNVLNNNGKCGIKASASPAEAQSSATFSPIVLKTNKGKGNGGRLIPTAQCILESETIQLESNDL